MDSVVERRLATSPPCHRCAVLLRDRALKTHLAGHHRETGRVGFERVAEAHVLVAWVVQRSFQHGCPPRYLAAVAALEAWRMEYEQLELSDEQQGSDATRARCLMAYVAGQFRAATTDHTMT